MHLRRSIYPFVHLEPTSPSSSSGPKAEKRDLALLTVDVLFDFLTFHSGQLEPRSYTFLYVICGVGVRA